MTLLKGRRLNPYKIARLVTVLTAMVLLVVTLTSGSKSEGPSRDLSSEAHPDTRADVIAPSSESTSSMQSLVGNLEGFLADNAAPTDEAIDCSIDALMSLDDAVVDRWKPGYDSMPGNCVKLRINYLGGTLGRVFNDSNYIHVEAARRIGIAPIATIDDILASSRPLVKIASNADYYVDQLTHSHPYLVPEAARLLADIGHAFRDSLEARGGGDYRIKVTSVLRTEGTLAKLRRRNGNAISESTHRFATTFDISYAKFICDDPTVARTQEDLKNLLGEILWSLRADGRCLVKYERKQSCFHITATSLN